MSDLDRPAIIVIYTKMLFVVQSSIFPCHHTLLDGLPWRNFTNELLLLVLASHRTKSRVQRYESLLIMVNSGFQLGLLVGCSVVKMDGWLETEAGLGRGRLCWDLVGGFDAHQEGDGQRRRGIILGTLPQ